jgi:two-component system response regulator AtoC
MPKYRILIVDDDRLLQESINDVLKDKFDTMIAGTGETAVKMLKKHPFDLVLLDIMLPGMDGIETLRAIRNIDVEVAVIMMTAYEDIKSVIKTMKMGAYDYLVKPLDIEELEVIIEKALDNLNLKRELRDIHRQKAKEFDMNNIIGQSAGMRIAMGMADTISKSADTTVLLEGETGTGKEVIAKAIHYGGDRFEKSFVSINCGAISKDLVESELFGYDKGTFTGGLQTGKKGKCELADGGTLFLDEVSELALSAQVKLLRFLEEKEFYRVGGTEKIRVNVRVIAATNQSLEEGIRRKTFREDLYYRLNVAKILLPPLRERKEDIMPLVRLFMDQFNEKFQKSFCGVTEDATQILLNHYWGGNVRELRNTIERIVLMENEKLISTEHLRFLANYRDLISPHHTNTNPDADHGVIHGGVQLTEHNRNLILKALDKAGGNKARAAKNLGISRSQLLYRLKKMAG